jgi:uncharacterized membrane protein
MIFMKTTPTLKKYRMWVMGLAIIGIGLASYLYYEYAIQETFGVCNINSVLNCNAVTKGALAEIWGLPVSIVGLVGYAAILISAKLRKFKIAFGMATFGMLFCLRLTYLEIFVEQAICPVCMACQIVMLIELFLTYRLAFPKKVDLLSEKD